MKSLVIQDHKKDCQAQQKIGYRQKNTVPGDCVGKHINNHMHDSQVKVFFDYQILSLSTKCATTTI